MLCLLHRQNTFMQARDRLWTAVSKSRGSETEALVRAIARACLLVPGFRACAAGYLTPPASYSRVAWFIRNDCPEYEFTDDFENSITSSTGNQNGEHDNDDAYSDDKSDSDDDYTDAQHDSDDDYTDAQYDSDEASSDQDSAEEGWTLTDLLELKQCQRYFTILHNPNSSQPWVSANWQALVNKPHLKKVQDVLPIVHTVPFHPDNPAFPKYCSKLTTTQPAASSAAQATFIMVKTVQKAQALHKIATDAQIIGLDCEGCRLSRNGKLCLVQVSAAGNNYLFDMLHINSTVLGYLKLVLEDKNIMKVVHDCRNDSVALFYQRGIRIQTIFDTQVAYEVQILSFPSKQHLAGHKIGLQQLLQLHKLPMSSTKAAITKKVTTDRNTWRCRPISDELLQSAAEDVSHLVILAEKMSLQFGSLLVQLVLGMSAIYSEAFWDDSDKASVGHNSAQSSKLADSWVYKLYTQVAPKT